MKRLLRVLFGVVFAAGLMLAGGAGALSVLGPPTYDVEIPALEVPRTDERIAQGRRLVTMACRGCHYDSNLRSLAGGHMHDLDPRIGKADSANITRDPEHGIGDWSDGELALALRTGIHPKTRQLLLPVMPRFPGMADEDLEAMVAFLGTDHRLTRASDKQRAPVVLTLWSKFHARTRWSPLPYPSDPVRAPDVGDPVAFGRYLVDSVLQCHACHSASLYEVDLIDAPATEGYLGGGAKLTALAGGKVSAANLTPHETGLADWTAEDLRRALIDGFRPDGTVLRWPMTRYHLLDQSEVEAIFAYLQTVEPIDNAIARDNIRVVGPKADPGLHAFQKYGCPYCHGPTGIGLVDMRGIDEEFPTDAELIAFFKAPARTYPDTGMPSWDGVVAEEDYPALCEIARRLSRETEERIAAAADPKKKKKKKTKK